MKKRQRSVKNPATKAKNLLPQKVKKAVRKVMLEKIKGTKISTSKQSKTLIELLFAVDNRSGHFGSEGYEVNKKCKLKDGTIVIFFKDRNNDPFSNFLLFIKGKSIFTNQRPDVIMRLLYINNISFFFNAKVKLPDKISTYLDKKNKTPT